MSSRHLCPARLQTRCDVCCACQSTGSFPLTPAWPGQEVHRSLCSGRLCVGVYQLGEPIPDSTHCSRFIESVRMIVCDICLSCWEVSRCIACVTFSASMVILYVPLSSWTVLPFLTVITQSDWYLVTEWAE